ncbi:MAG: hypothetical protein ACK4ZR_02365 [Aquificaceae bacterium]
MSVLLSINLNYDKGERWYNIAMLVSLISTLSMLTIAVSGIAIIVGIFLIKL